MFRFRKDIATCVDIIELIDEEISQPTSGNRSVPPMFQVLTALHFYATGTFQLTIGDLMKFFSAHSLQNYTVSVDFSHKKAVPVPS